MNTKDPKLIVLQFNECINNRNIKELANLISNDHKFIDSNNETHDGKETMIKEWQRFFDLLPDYQNHFSILESKGDEVFIIGHSTCSVKELDGPALWSARVENDLVVEWRVYLDTIENRKILNLDNPFRSN